VPLLLLAPTPLRALPSLLLAGTLSHPLTFFPQSNFLTGATPLRVEAALPCSARSTSPSSRALPARTTTLLLASPTACSAPVSLPAERTLARVTAAAPSSTPPRPWSVLCPGVLDVPSPESPVSTLASVLLGLSLPATRRRVLGNEKDDVMV
jgi:hypothetical protein